MTRLIDADALTTAVLKNAIEYAVVFGDSEMHRLLVHVIAHQPTIDAVHVIRCKDCKYGEMRTIGDTAKYCRKIINEWDYTEPVYLDKDFYCAWAESKE